MATDKELSGFIVNEVESDDKLSKISQEQTLEPNQIFVTKDGIISDNAVGLPIGAIFASAIPITDARVHLLDGSIISQSGIYQEFATLLNSLDAAGQPIRCSEQQFIDDVALTGNCGKFVINNSAGTIRLPKITTFIQGLDSISDIGKGLGAGLPNINGALKVNYTYSATPFTQQQNGALGASRDGNSEYYVSGRASGSGWANDIYFNARNSNEIYGNSNTVQPQATQFPYYIVLASGYKSKKSLNVDNIMKEVNTKATLDDIYPVGSIYISVNSRSPASMFGGTWERIKDRFLLGAGSTYTEIYKDNGDGTYKGVGGAATHTLTVDQMPYHNHAYRASTSTYWSGVPHCITQAAGSGNADGTLIQSSDVWWSGVLPKGGSQAHNNMPPYATVYMWQRVTDNENDSEVDNY